MVAHEDQQSVFTDIICNFFHTADEFRSEDQNIHFRQIQAVFDFVGGITEVQRNHQCSGLQNTEVDWEPFQTVHQKDRNFVPLLYTAGDQHVRKAVCLFVENVPGDLTTIIGHRTGLHQVVFLPGHTTGFFYFRVDFH